MDLKITIAFICAIVLGFNLLGYRQQMEEYEALLVIGGRNKNGSLDTSELLQMNTHLPKVRAFCNITKFPKKIHGATGALLSNDMPIVCGGSTKSVLATKDCYVLRNCQNGCLRFTGQKFSHVGVWSPIKMIQARSHASSIPINSTHLWITGGRGNSGTGKFKKTTELINIRDNTSNLYYELEHGIEDHAMVHIDNMQLTVIIGGKIDTIRHGEASNKTYLFDHNSESFESGPTLLQSRYGHSAGVIYADKGTIREKVGIVVVGGCVDTQHCLNSVEILWDICPNAQWISGPSLNFEVGQPRAILSEMLKIDFTKDILDKTGQSVSIPDFENQEDPIIGHKIVHSNDGNLVMVGGYKNSTGSWSNVVRRLRCRTYKKDLNPICDWRDMYDGELAIGRVDHVPMMLHHDICNIGNMFQALGTIDFIEQLGMYWQLGTFLSVLWYLIKSWYYGNMGNVTIIMRTCLLFYVLHFWILPSRYGFELLHYFGPFSLLPCFGLPKIFDEDTTALMMLFLGTISLILLLYTKVLTLSQGAITILMNLPQPISLILLLYTKVLTLSQGAITIIMDLPQSTTPFILFIVSKCLCGLDKQSWKIINMISYLMYVPSCVFYKDWHSIIIIGVLLPIQWLIIQLSKLHFQSSFQQDLLEIISFISSGVLEPKSIESRTSNFFRTITEPCILIVFSELLPSWMKSNITRFLETTVNWGLNSPYFMTSCCQQIIIQTWKMISEQFIRFKNFIELSYYKRRQKWIWETPCKITRKTNFVYELNCDSESIHTVTSPDFLQQMVNYFIEDFQKNHLIVFSGERRTKAIKAISKACEIEIYGKPKDMQKRFEKTKKYGGTLDTIRYSIDTGSDVEISLPNLYPRYPFKITIQNSIKYNTFWEIMRFWSAGRRANESNNFDVNNAEENVNPIEQENEGNNNECHNDSEAVPYLNNFVKHFKAQRYIEASKICVDAFAVAKSDEENIVLKYCHSMALLCSKDLANAETGYNNLKELYELKLVKWKSEFPAIYHGLAKYELALRVADFEFLNEEFIEVLNPIKVPCHDVLKEIFPEMEFDVVQNGLMQTLRNSINMDVVATCRYKNCRNIFEKSERGILNWKSTIKFEDIDYKGFTQLKCTDKCIVDFHPWCWKDKKEEDFKREKHDGLLHKTLLDKDYLKLNCPTPDCNAPVFKVSLFKDDLKCPLELTDDELTRKILAGGKPKNSQKPSADSEPKIENDIELEDSKYKNSMKVLEERKEKDLHRQIRGLQKKIHKDKLEMAKCEIANKHLMKENADLAASHDLNMEEFKYQNQQLQTKNDELIRNHEEEPYDQDKELCYLFLQKSIEFENFAENINNILLRNGILCLELSRIQSEATDRTKKIKEIIQQSPEDRKPGQIKALIKMNLEVDYEKLKEFCISNLNTYLFEEEETEETSEPV